RGGGRARLRPRGDHRDRSGQRRLRAPRHVRAAMTTLRALAEKVRSREIGAHELVARSFRRIETLAENLGAVVALRSEALAEARMLDEQVAAGAGAGPLAGLPLLVKDMTDVAGMRTTFGSRGFEGAAGA